MAYTLGFDEVGRGSLAGPVTVGLVALPEYFPLLTAHSWQQTYPQDYSEFSFVRDSKNLSEKLRQLAVDKIKQKNLPAMILSASNELIDQYGISPCLRHLLLLGYNAITHPQNNPIIGSILIDGRVSFPATVNEELMAKIQLENNLSLNSINAPTSSTSVHNEDKADDKYLSIALASCLAKISRDLYMCQQAHLYPEYKWDTNKGYGTALHREAIMNNRSNPLIRKTFIKNIPLL